MFRFAAANHVTRSRGFRCYRAGVFAVALLGLLTLGSSQARASHIDCGATLMTSVILDGDLTDCPADGLIVGADNITIDLNGHTIDGPGTDDFRWDGVDNGAGHDRVTVKNGTIQDFGGDGVYIDNGGMANGLENLVLADNGIGSEVIASQTNSIQGATIEENHAFGIVVGESSHTRIQNSVIAQNEADGILARNSSENVFDKNYIDAGAFGTGMQVLGGSGNKITQNVITTSAHSFDGIFFASDAGVISKNDVHGFVDAAVFISGGEGQGGTRIEKNSVHDNGLGVLVRGNPFFCCLTGLVISKNVVFDNEVVGIGVRDVAEASVDSNFVHDNGLGVGVKNSIGVEATGSEVVANRSNGNADDGIQVLVPGTTITGNSANFNANYGIQAVVGAVDGGHNMARGNGNPAQCLNVSCGP